MPETLYSLSSSGKNYLLQKNTKCIVVVLTTNHSLSSHLSLYLYLWSYNGLVFSQVSHACSLTQLFALASNCESPEGCLSNLNPQTKTTSASLLCHHTNTPLHSQTITPHILNLVQSYTEGCFQFHWSVICPLSIQVLTQGVAVDGLQIY